MEIDLTQYEVVRKNYITDSEALIITFNAGYIYVNAACIKTWPNIEYVHFLVKKDEKRLLVEACADKVRDSFKWTTNGKKRTARHIRCQPLYYLIYDMMGWNMMDRYRIIGYEESANGATVISFNLAEAEKYAYNEETQEYSKIPIFPAEWANSFGNTVVDSNEVQKHGEIKTFSDVSVIEMTLPKSKKNALPNREVVADGTQSADVSE